MASKPAYVWDGSAWQQIGPVVNSPIKFQTTAPASPSTGDVWVDSDGALDSLITNTGDFVSQSAFNSSVSSLSSSKANISGQVYTGTHNFTGAALSGAGLDLITSQSFSSVTSVNFNNCFTSVYENYRVLFRATSSTSFEVNYRMRVGGADETGSNYQYEYIIFSNTVVSPYRVTAQTSGFFTSLSTGHNAFSADIFSPAIATPTIYVCDAVRNGNTTSIEKIISSGGHSLSTAYDGITFICTSGTFSGMIRIYGYRNA